MRQEHRLFAKGRPAGLALCEEAGTSTRFEAVIGEHGTTRRITGRAVVDDALAFTLIEVEFDGQGINVLPPRGAVVDIEGAPGLFGLTARRLLAKDPHPGEAHEVVIVRVRPDGDVKEKRGRCVWVGGVEWSLLALGEATRFRVREDGRVASVQATAELVE